MKKILTLLLVGASFILPATAQIDTVALKKSIKVSTDSLVATYWRSDWRNNAQYLNEKTIEEMGGVDGFVSFMEKMIKDGIGVFRRDTIFFGELLQLVKVPSGYQSLIELFRQNTSLADDQSHSNCTYWIGVSADGKAWRFYSIGSEENIESYIPGLSPELKKPEAIFRDMPMKEFLEMYKKEFTPVIK